MDGGAFQCYGYLCGLNTNSLDDKHVSIYFVPGIGYQYKE